LRCDPYVPLLKKKLSDALGKLTHLNFEQKQYAWELIEQFLERGETWNA
jgi:hypothetical protein